MRRPGKIDPTRQAEPEIGLNIAVWICRIRVRVEFGSTYITQVFPGWVRVKKIRVGYIRLNVYNIKSFLLYSAFNNSDWVRVNLVRSKKSLDWVQVAGIFELAWVRDKSGGVKFDPTRTSRARLPDLLMQKRTTRSPTFLVPASFFELVW